MNRLAKYQGLRFKLLAATVIITVVVGCVMIAFVRTFFSHSVQTGFRDNWIYIALHLASDVIDPVLARDRLALRAMISERGDSLSDAEYIFLVSENGKVLAHTFDDGFPAYLLALGPHDDGVQRVQEVLLGSLHVFDVSVPMLDGKLGKVHIGFTATSLMEDTNRVTGVILAAIIAALVLQVPLVGILCAYLTKPISRLRELADEVRQVGRGEFGHEVRVASRDEVGELADAYNDMRSDLERYRKRLRSLASQVLLVEERERHRIAGELHDLIGQTMALSKIKLGALRAQAADAPWRKDVDDIRDMIERMIRDTHSLILDLQSAGAL